MTQQHPIPPPELVEQWHSNSPLDRGLTVATLAAQWGADQELEACVQWLDENLPGYDACEGSLRAARRPKPPSLKEQALEALMTADGPDHPTPVLYLRPDAASIIRRALESIPDPS